MVVATSTKECRGCHNHDIRPGGGAAGRTTGVAGVISGAGEEGGLGHRGLQVWASAAALPIAASVRSSSSSQSAGVISTPGLYCRTRGSRVEKIAQTPAS